MNTPSFQSFRRSLMMVAAVGLLAAASHAQTPLLHYTLDGNGNDSGSLNIDGVTQNQAFFTQTGAGVGRFSEALSTDNGTNDYFVAGTGGNAALGLDAITIALWVNIDGGASTDRLVSNISTSAGFDFYIQNYTTGTDGVGKYNLAFGFNSTSGAVQSASTNYVTDKWLFLAVTYNSTTETVSFYSGDLSSATGLNSTASKTGSIAASALDLEIGGTPVTTADRSPIALFNDVRIYSGALTLTEIEAIRVTAIPEPSSYGFILGAASLGCIALRRRR